MCLGQVLPDRDELIAQFVDPATNQTGAQELIKHFQMGGLRSIIRNLDKLPPDLRVQWCFALKDLDLMRFRNDLNANVQETADPTSKGLFLMLLATIGRALDPSLFNEYVNNSGYELKVRLAAASGPIQIQNPTYYDKFHQLAEEATVDPGTGQNDFMFSLIDRSNVGFYFYTKGKIERGVDRGIALTAIALVDNGDLDLWNSLLDLREKDYLPMMIDRAIRVGGVDLLNAMEEHRMGRKVRDELPKAIEAAAVIAKYREQLHTKPDPELVPLAPVLPIRATGQSETEGYRAAYTIVKVSADGTVSVVEDLSPFGAMVNALPEKLPKTTFPAYRDWKPAESYHLVFSP